MDRDRLEVLLLLGRPASGKSEVIDYLRRLDAGERRRRFGIGDLVVFDDFPMLWAWFEEDAILESVGKDRLHTTSDGYFLGPHLWQVLIRRISLEYDKLRARESGGTDTRTVLIEFSRGSEHGGYRAALGELSEEILRRAAVLYIRVSYEESLRKNRRRFNPSRPHSILEHALPDDKMERLYRVDDWQEIERPDPDHINVRGHSIPAVVFENEDDVTTPRGDELGRRLEECLARLWRLKETQQPSP